MATTINLSSHYDSMNISASDAFQADLGWAVLTGAHTIAALAEATGATKSRVTYHVKKMAKRGQLALSKEKVNGRLVLVARCVGQTIPCPAVNELPHDKTVDAKFERIVRTANHNPAALSRACERVARLGKRTLDSALLDLAMALSEQRHVALQARLQASAEASGDQAGREQAISAMAYHCQNRDSLLASARRWVARHPNCRHLAA
jgi:hypothetical protein